MGEQGDLLWTSETAVFCNRNLKYPLKEGDVISQYTATSKRVNQMGHHKKSRRQIMGLWPVLPTDSVKLVFTRIPTFLSKKGIKLFRGIFRCFQIFKTVSKLFGYFQMVSKLSGLSKYFVMTSIFPDGFKTVRIFPDDLKLSSCYPKIYGLLCL